MGTFRKYRCLGPSPACADLTWSGLQPGSQHSAHLPGLWTRRWAESRSSGCLEKPAFLMASVKEAFYITHGYTFRNGVFPARFLTVARHPLYIHDITPLTLPVHFPHGQVPHEGRPFVWFTARYQLLAQCLVHVRRPFNNCRTNRRSCKEGNAGCWDGTGRAA